MTKIGIIMDKSDIKKIEGGGCPYGHALPPLLPRSIGGVHDDLKKCSPVLWVGMIMGMV